MTPDPTPPDSVRLEQETRLRQTQKLEAIGTLAGGIAHEFNNILGAILGYAGMTREDLPEGSVQRANIEEILAAARRGRDLVQQILTFGQQQAVERRPVELRPIVLAAGKLLRASLPTSVPLTQRLAREPMVVVADPGELHQVVVSLGTNAYQALPDGKGELSLALDRQMIDTEGAARRPGLLQQPYARLTVSDTGQGMPAAVVERAFDPFLAARDRRSAPGMGLSIAHGIVTDMRGAIFVSSAPGAGTIVEVFLPLAEAAASGPDETPRTLGRGEHVLFVDDEDVLVRLATPMLTRLGYRVTACGSGREALERLQANPAGFDVLMTDQMMPGMQGTELIRHAREIRPDLVVVLCTGYSERPVNDTDRPCLLLQKPLTMAEMADALRAAITRSER